MNLRPLQIGLLALILLATPAVWALKVKELGEGMGVLIYEEIGGSSDEVDKFEIGVIPFTKYALLLVGLGDGDLDVVVKTPEGEVLARGNSFRDVEALTFNPSSFQVIVEVRVAGGYGTSEGYVVLILGLVGRVEQTG